MILTEARDCIEGVLVMIGRGEREGIVGEVGSDRKRKLRFRSFDEVAFAVDALIRRLS